jgi:AcrR family transcriptional regulator
MSAGTVTSSAAPGAASPANIGGMSPAGERVPYAVAARELLRSTLLDAAHSELQNRPWTQISMADVARAAGVSRQTLYKEFGTRDEFAQAFVLREGERFLGEVEQAVKEHLDSPIAALSGAFDVFMAAVAENPLVRTIVRDDGAADLLPLFTTHGAPVVQYATGRLTEVISSGWPQVRPADAQLLAECLVRLAISYAALPAQPPATSTEAVMTLLGPFVERALAEALANCRH